MPKDETSPEQEQEGTSQTEGGEQPSHGEESPASPEESVSQDQIERWRALEAKAKEQNVDLENLLPEYTRSRQQLKDYQTENAQWRDAFQRMHVERQQQQAQGDPESMLRQKIQQAEAEGDYRTAKDLEDKLIEHRVQKIAEAQFSRLTQQQQQAQVRDGLYRTAAEKFGLSQREMDELAPRAAVNPEAMSVALAWQRDPNLVRDMVLQREREREKRAEAASRTSSLASSGGRRVPGSLDAEQSRPTRVPASVYYAFPEAVAKKKWPNAEVVQGS